MEHCAGCEIRFSDTKDNILNEQYLFLIKFSTGTIT